MKILVAYGSRYGNTEKIADAISTGLRSAGDVEMVTVQKAQPVRLHDFDLVVVGGPTEGHGVTEDVAAYIDEVGEAVSGVTVAAFDTRMRWPKWLSGSAAEKIASRLEGLGAKVVVPPASFVVSGKTPVLEPGELERAEAWGRALAIKLAPQPVAGV